jgi:hypothetical protein
MPHQLLAKQEECHSRDLMSSSPGSRPVVLTFSIIILGVLLMGALSSLLDSNIFWLIIAVWTVSVASFLLLTNGKSRLAVICVSAVMAIPFILMLMGEALVLDLSNVSVLITWAAEIPSLFALCLVTLMMLNTRTSVRMSRSLIAGFIFLFFETVSALQGPMGYYNDLWLGTNHMPDNTDLMAYLIVSTFGGVVLLIVSILLIKRSAVRDLQRKVVGP